MSCNGHIAAIVPIDFPWYRGVMRGAPHRLIAKRSPLLPPDDRAGGDHVLSGRMLRRTHRLRAIRRFAQVVLWTLLALPVQALLLAWPNGRGAADRFARVYWRGMCRMIGLKVQVIGAPLV